MLPLRLPLQLLEGQEVKQVIPIFKSSVSTSNQLQPAGSQCKQKVSKKKHQADAIGLCEDDAIDFGAHFHQKNGAVWVVGVAAVLVAWGAAFAETACGTFRSVTIEQQKGGINSYRGIFGDHRYTQKKLHGDR
jgi:hypothetical protein